MSRSTCILVTLLLFAVSAFAQFETAEVLGTVKDASGASLKGASVTLTNQSTGVDKKNVSDDGGLYDFFNVAPGRYTITAEAAGFQTFKTTDVVVDVNARQRVDMTMQVGAVNQVVNVSGAAETLETDSSQHDQVINTQQIVQLPLNGRNYSDLALLATNTHRSPLSVLFAANGTPREGSFNVNGMRSTYNNFLLDGVDNNAYSTSNQGYSNQVVQPSPDAVAEFRLITSNFSAEYGRVGGGVINAATRSGSNEFHGTLYDFLRNTDLNAVGFTFSPAVFQKPTLQRNQFGVTIGGPIIKNKLFFFGDYEGQRQLQRYLNFDSIPDSTDRAGVLPVTVYDPVNHAVYSANTQIPVSALNPFAATVLGQLPSQNGPGRSNNYEALLLVRDYYDKYDAKLDWNISDKQTGFIRFSQRKDLQYYQPDIPGPSGGNGNGYIHAISQQAAIGYTWALTPTSVLDARFAFDHILAGKEPPYLGGPSMDQLYGIPGLPTTLNLTGGLNSQTISGFSQLGRQTSNPQFQNPTTFNPKINFSKVVGRHALKMGYEWTDIRTEVLDINPLYGADTYAGQFSKPTCAVLGQPSNCAIASDATSYNLADFMFGLPSTIQLGNNLVTNLRQHINALYFQDDWRVNEKLTLNLGLRWEYATPLWERDNLWSNFDPATDTIIRASNGGIYNRALVNPDYKDFGPRIGFAYSATSKTVIRGGYGISYAFENRPGSAQEGINAPLALFGLLTQSIPAGGSVPAGFLTTQNSFTTGLDVPSNFNPIVSNIDYIPANTKWPYIQSWLFSVQQELTKNTFFEVAYNGNHSLRLPILGDYNQANPNSVTATCNTTITPAITSGCLGVQARRPIQTFGAITWLDPAGDNDYNGFSTRLEHRFGGGLYFLNSFTWSKALGDSEQALEYYPGYYQANPQNIRNLSAERGPSSFDVEFIDVTSVVYQLPFGRGRQFGSNVNPFVDAVLGGWELNTINTWNTGTPIDVSYSPASINDVTGLTNDYRGEAILRPNVSGQAQTGLTTNQLVNNYFAGYTFTTPGANNPFGGAGRNSFRAPSLWQWDLAADKNFHITERANLQFRSEFFNVLNHTNFGLPTPVTTSSAFGTIRTTYPARQIQFALKLLF
ncbi:MAG TPA: TonB-dependent receptor [Bryobacteraceae bacterium]|nr:TonB-dependent receptor [Bryobacteraceae bacterium]